MEDLLTLRWRIGRKLGGPGGRTLYAMLPDGVPADDDIFIGLMETRELAELVCREHNRSLGK